MKVIQFAASAVLLALGLGGCATVTRGTTTDFSVNSTPPGAGAKTSTGFSCEPTPCSMKMPRKTDFDVTLAKAGYVSRTLHVRSVVSGGGTAGLVGNVVVGGVVGIVVDAFSGAMNDLTPNPMTVVLDPEDASAAQQSAEPPATPSTPSTPVSAAATAPAQNSAVKP